MRSLKVLVLEDNSFQLMALHQMLNANGIFDVLTADSVESARRSLGNRGAVDIVICDLYMSGPNGFDLIRQLAKSHETQALIILSSAQPQALEEAAQLARLKGIRVLGYLQKPASVLALHHLLRSYEALEPSEYREMKDQSSPCS